MGNTSKVLLSVLERGGNIRDDPGPQEDLRNLGHAYKKRPIHPIIGYRDADGKIKIADGWRRVCGLRLIGEIEVDVTLMEKEPTEAEIIDICLVSAMHRADLSGYEKWQGCEKLLELHPGWLGKDLAAHLNIDPGMVTKYLSPSKALPCVQEVLKSGAITIKQVYAISMVNESEQFGMLEAAINGASGEQLQHAARRKRNAPTITEKVSKLKCQMEDGVVQVSGKDMDLEAACEIVQAWLKRAKKALEAGWNCKTLEQACKAEAGV